jgi:uncharacterized glyoxalase superfamily protein PhnB
MQVKVDEIALRFRDDSKQKAMISFYKTKLLPIYDTQDETVFRFGDSGRVLFGKNNEKGEDEIGKSFEGFSLARPTAENLTTESATDSNVVRSFQVYQYGASMLPNEDEMLLTDVSYAWMLDPVGFKIELRQDRVSHDRLVLNVLDIDEAIDFYCKVLGFSLLRKRSNVNNRPREASMSAYLGNIDEKESSTIELRYKYSTKKIVRGNVFQEIVLKTDNFQKVQDAVREKNIPFTWNSDDSISLTDRSGYKLKVKEA